MAPAPLLHSFTEGYVDGIGSLNTVEANLPISPRAAASIQAYQATVSAKSTFHLPPDYALITVPTHRHTRVYPPRSQRSTSVAANTATQKGITIPQRTAANRLIPLTTRPTTFNKALILAIQYSRTPTLYVLKLFCCVSVAH
jgi:hypothetical protein